MTDLDLDAIQARCDAATPGPWAADGDACPGPDDSLTVYPVNEGGAVAYVQPAWNDAEFIAAAREDIPALVAEVRRLRTLLAQEDYDQDRIWAHLKQLIADERTTEDLEDLIKDDSYVHGLMAAHGDKVAGRKWGDPE